jgi:hypothetical protein
MLRNGFAFVAVTGVPCSGLVGTIACLVDFYVAVLSVVLYLISCGLAENVGCSGLVLIWYSVPPKGQIMKY